jgi:hypothetical protein
MKSLVESDKSKLESEPFQKFHNSGTLIIAF